MDYFPHDFGAHDDPKLMMLRIAGGYKYVGIYWTLLEIIGATEHRAWPDDQLLALSRAMQLKLNTLSTVIDALLNVGLMRHDGGFYYSSGLHHRMVEIDSKREQRKQNARDAANERWKRRFPNANASSGASERIPPSMQPIPIIEEPKPKVEENRGEMENGAIAPDPPAPTGLPYPPTPWPKFPEEPPVEPTPKKPKRSVVFEERHMKFAEWYFEQLKSAYPSAVKPTEPLLQKWANEARLLEQSADLRSVAAVVQWAFRDPFWSSKGIVSLMGVAGLRKKWDKLKIQFDQRGTGNSTNNRTGLRTATDDDARELLEAARRFDESQGRVS